MVADGEQLLEPPGHGHEGPNGRVPRIPVPAQSGQEAVREAEQAVREDPQVLPVGANEPGQLAALHHRHLAGHVPAAQRHPCRLRVPAPRPQRYRVLQRLQHQPARKAPQNC